MRLVCLSLAFLPALNSGCQKKSSQKDVTPSKVTVSPAIEEASGIADSKTQPGHLWVVEDSGNPPELILLGHDGTVLRSLPVRGARNRDWEELVLAAGHIYIGDIGDNSEQKKEYTIYRAPEPAASATEVPAVEAIRFRYSDKPHDAEAFLVDGPTGDLYIITKRDAASLVFRVAFPYSLTQENVAEQVGTLPFTGVTAAALSPDGSAILVKTYGKLYRFSRKNGETIASALQRTPTEAPYVREPQGEAVCFKLDGSGYFTLSEQLMSMPVELFFYPK